MKVKMFISEVTSRFKGNKSEADAIKLLRRRLNQTEGQISFEECNLGKLKRELCELEFELEERLYTTDSMYKEGGAWLDYNIEIENSIGDKEEEIRKQEITIDRYKRLLGRLNKEA